MSAFGEAVAKQDAFGCPEGITRSIADRAEIAPGKTFAETIDCGRAVPDRRWRDTLLLTPIAGKLRVTDAERFKAEALT
jgi:hypothetical protein